MRLNIRKAASAAGVEHPFGLWKKFGGSKTTTAQLWGDVETGTSDVTGINFDTLERLMTILNLRSAKDLSKLFEVVEVKRGGEEWEAGYSPTRASAPPAKKRRKSRPPKKTKSSGKKARPK